jgi:hypothetical protein
VEFQAEMIARLMSCAAFPAYCFIAVPHFLKKGAARRRNLEKAAICRG